MAFNPTQYVTLSLGYVSKNQEKIARVPIQAGVAYLLKKVEFSWFDGQLSAAENQAYWGLGLSLSHGATVNASYDPADQRVICAANAGGPGQGAIGGYVFADSGGTYIWEAPTSFYTVGPNLYLTGYQYLFDTLQMSARVFFTAYRYGATSEKYAQIPRF